MSDVHAEGEPADEQPHSSEGTEALRQELDRLRAANEATERRLRATHAVSRVLATETAIDVAMPQILAALGPALGCVLASYWVPGSNGGLELGASWSDKTVAVKWDDECRRHRFQLGEGLPGRVWQDRGPVWLADVSPAQLPRKAAMASERIASAFALPIAAGNEILGVIELFSRTHETPDDQLIEVLRTVGGHLGQFIHASRMQDQLREQAEQSAAIARELELERQTLSKLDDISRRTGVEADQQTLLQGITDVATELTGARFGAFFDATPDEPGVLNGMSLQTVSGILREELAKLALPTSTASFSPTLDAKVVVRSDDITQDKRYSRHASHKGLAAQALVRSYLAVPVVSRTGSVVGLLVFGHPEADVFTERSQRLATNLAANAATALDTARLFGDAQRLIKELEKTNYELDQFAYVASHDLRAPLRGITNLAGWIEEDLGTTAPKKIREYIVLLKSRVARMDKLIVGLMELARIGRARQRPERVELTELLHETIDLLSPPATARILIIGAMPTLIAERVAMQQVLLNLIGNSIVHSRRKDVVVRITSIERADEIEIAISDNGVGIAPEHHERVWEIFQTLHDRDTIETTGMGLTMVKKQVEAHGGRAWIDPQVREGATLHFTWPKRPVR